MDCSCLAFLRAKKPAVGRFAGAPSSSREPRPSNLGNDAWRAAAAYLHKSNGREAAAIQPLPPYAASEATVPFVQAIDVCAILCP